MILRPFPYLSDGRKSHQSNLTATPSSIFFLESVLILQMFHVLEVTDLNECKKNVNRYLKQTIDDGF